MIPVSTAKKVFQRLQVVSVIAVCMRLLGGQDITHHNHNHRSGSSSFCSSSRMTEMLGATETCYLFALVPAYNAPAKKERKKKVTQRRGLSNCCGCWRMRCPMAVCRVLDDCRATHWGRGVRLKSLASHWTVALVISFPANSGRVGSSGRPSLAEFGANVRARADDPDGLIVADVALRIRK